jgi:sec-independent protein translocase protein TatA
VPLGPWELVIILIIVVVIFGAGRLSQIGGAVGKSVREFRSAVHDDDSAATAHAGAPVAQATAVVLPDLECPACHAANPAGRKFCGTCGASLVAAPAAVTTPVAAPGSSTPTPVENTCPSCATVNPSGQAFCGQCGTRLSRAA